jgi:hypothetical protein
MGSVVLASYLSSHSPYFQAVGVVEAKGLEVVFRKNVLVLGTVNPWNLLIGWWKEWDEGYGGLHRSQGHKHAGTSDMANLPYLGKARRKRNAYIHH